MRLENNTLTVRGERKFEAEKKAENYLRVERRYGGFTRTFTLPNTISGDKVEANYADGVLEIRCRSVRRRSPNRSRWAWGGAEPTPRRRRQSNQEETVNA